MESRESMASIAGPTMRRAFRSAKCAWRPRRGAPCKRPDTGNPEVTASVLVTGASGFVGSALTQHLVQRGHRVRAAVRHCAPPAGIECVQAELSPHTDWTAALEGIDTVVHAAARVHVMRDTARAPLEAFRSVNVEGTARLAEQAAACGVRRFVFLSSVKVLGESTPPDRALADDSPAHPQDDYARSKLEAEQRLLALAAQTGLEVVVVRPPLVYGPGVKGNFAALVRWIRAGRPLPFGALDNRRSLVALDNLVSLLALCADRSRSPAAANQIFLVGDGEDVSTAELARRIADAYAKRLVMLPVPPVLFRWAAAALHRQDAAERLLGSLRVDDSRCRELLGWRPVVSMIGQLRSMAQHDSAL